MDLKRSGDPENKQYNPPQVAWLSSLRFKLGVGLFLLFLILVCSNLWLIWFKGLPLLVQQSKELNEQIGQNIVTELNQQFMQAETLTKDIANLAEALPTEDQLFKSTIPHLLDLESMRDIIAGGGFWPEPFRFDPDKERASFFWGREANGVLKFYDDYNALDGPGYHNEEWYVPTTRLQAGSAYWSRSYTDPYSLQPMVTCSVPIHRANTLMGVATVDLKLEGVNKLVTEKIGSRSGYAFVIDRNNKFISYPDQNMVITQRSENNQQEYTDFIYAKELAKKAPNFQEIADKLDFISYRNTTIVNRDADRIKTVAKNIADKSYQINIQEARLIAHNLFRNGEGNIAVLDRFEISDDVFLHGKSDVTVYQMPHTYWKVITVFPLEDTIEAARDISESVTWGSLTGIAIWGMLCTGFLWRVLFSRLHDMTDRIRQSAHDGREIPLDHSANDELGLLAQWYNRRTKQLHQALRSAEVSAHDLKRENNEHKVTAKLLERSLSMQRAILDSANLAIITLDKQGRILNCNAGTTKLLGYREQDLVGKTFPHALIDKQQMEEYRVDLQQRYDVNISGFRLFTTALDKGERQENEWTFTCKNGVKLDVMLSITAVISPHHSIEGWLAVVADISERKQAQGELERARHIAESSNQAKSQFLASMSHELRTPLNAILGFTRRLQKYFKESESDNNQALRNLDALNTIERNTHHLMELISDLLDISKIEEGKLELESKLFDLGKLVEEVHSDTHSLAGNRDIQYSFTLPRNGAYLQGDRAKIKQIIYNLVSNAFRATEQGSIQIGVTVQHHNNTALIKVTDTGRGITPEDSKHLFEKFSNLHNYTSNQLSSGLGLFITMELVKLHEGNISFESIPGEGSTFIVELPLHPGRKDDDT
ncbi:ATP-binding protein [Ketobacter alkanivorans]|nr:ATP-binding protein [Ketobacter alkanivorans]